MRGGSPVLPTLDQQGCAGQGGRKDLSLGASPGFVSAGRKGLSAPREEQIWFGTDLVLRGPPIIEAWLRDERSVGSVSGLRRAGGPQRPASPAGASPLAWALPAAPEPDEAHVGPSGGWCEVGAPLRHVCQPPRL